MSLIIRKMKQKLVRNTKNTIFPAGVFRAAEPSVAFYAETHSEAPDGSRTSFLLTDSVEDKSVFSSSDRFKVWLCDDRVF